MNVGTLRFAWVRIGPFRGGESADAAESNLFERDVAPLLFDELDVEGDAYFIADHESTRFKSRVPDQAEVFAIDFCGGLDPDARAAPGILLRRAGRFDLQCHFPGYAVDCEVTLDGEFATLFFADFARLKGDIGKLFHVEEIRALQVGIALWFAGVDAIGVDGDLKAGLGNVGAIELQAAFEGGEFALHVREHQVFDLELSGGMNGIDLPSGHAGFRLYGGAHVGILLVIMIVVVTTNALLMSGLRVWLHRGRDPALRITRLPGGKKGLPGDRSVAKRPGLLGSLKPGVF